MKLTRYLVMGILWGCPDLSDYDWGKDDFPFSITDEEINEYWETGHCKSLEEKSENYWKEHNIVVVKESISYVDLEKAYKVLDIVFRFDDKYYSFSYKYSHNWEDTSVIGSNAKEVRPVEKTVIVYE